MVLEATIDGVEIGEPHVVVRTTEEVEMTTGDQEGDVEGLATEIEGAMKEKGLAGQMISRNPMQASFLVHSFLILDQKSETFSRRNLAGHPPDFKRFWYLLLYTKHKRPQIYIKLTRLKDNDNRKIS